MPSTGWRTCWPASTPTSPWSATTTRASTPGAAPTSATSSSSSAIIPNAKVVRLEQNYRSTQPILDVANAVVKNNRRRKGKNLWTGRGAGATVQLVEVNDERAEAQFIASEVQRLLEGRAWAGARQ